LNFNPDDDPVVNLINQYSLKQNKNVLEIGCSASYRRGAIKKLSVNSNVYGIEPSKDVIAYGKEHFPEVNLVHGTADDYPPLATPVLI